MVYRLGRIVSYTWAFAALLILYVLTYGADIFLAIFGVGTPAEMFTFRLIVLGVITAAYSGLRYIKAHPLCDKKYYMWLCSVPFDAKTALIKSPLKLIPLDIGLLLAATVLAWMNGGIYWYLPLFVFSGVRIVAHILISFCMRRLEIPFLIIVLLPFAAYPHMNINIAMFIVVFFVLLVEYDIYKILKDFPFNTPWWTDDPVEKWKEKAAQENHFGWPWKDLIVPDKIDKIRPTEAAILSGAVLLYIHLGVWFFGSGIFDGAFFFIASFLLVEIRIMAHTFTAAPPISLWGRIRTGHLIIPSYDVFLVCPLVMILTALLGPMLLGAFDININLSKELTLAIMLFEALTIGPDMNTWRYTGKKRIRKRRYGETRTKNTPPNLKKIFAK